MTIRLTTTQTVLLSLTAVTIALVAIGQGNLWWNTRLIPASTLDVSEVSSLRITGDASLVDITTDAKAPQTATLSSRNSGWGAVWQSGWFSGGCGSPGRMHIEATTLIVEVGSQSAWFDLSDCTTELVANLRPETAIVIDQKASRTRLAGDFSTVTINSDAGDVVLEGHATDISISGQALRARLAFEHVMQDETIALAGKMMSATLQFIQPTPISYLVEATASYIDSALPNTPGARPEIRIKGEMVHTTIR